MWGRTQNIGKFLPGFGQFSVKARTRNFVGEAGN
jgi:hypothetical protein